MSSLFPGSLDSFTLIPALTKLGDIIGARTHRQSHNDLGDAVEALEAKLGIGAATAVNNSALVGTGAGTSTWAQIPMTALATNSVSVRPAAAAGSTNPTTTNTATAALANPTVSITVPTGVSMDIYAWCTSEINDGTGGAQVGYHLRLGGGAWIQVAEISAPSAAGRFPISGFHVFGGVAAGTYSVEIGNSSSTGANTITHYAIGRRLMVLGIAK